MLRRFIWINSHTATRRKKSFISVSYKVFHRKERDILSLLISLRKASLLFTALSKKALKLCASVFWEREWIKSLTSHSAIELKRALFVLCFSRARTPSNPTSAKRRFRHENLAQLSNCSITLLAIFIFSRAYRQWDIKGRTKTIDDKVTHPVQLVQLSNLARASLIYLNN